MEPNKSCVCKGLSLLNNMLDIYINWLGDRSSVDSVAIPMATKLYNHLSDNAKIYDSKEIAPLLVKMQTAIDKSKSGKYSPMIALEVVRSAIHKNDILKYALICGRPPDRSRTLNIISEVFNIIDEGEVSDAKPILEEHIKNITCSK